METIVIQKDKHNFKEYNDFKWLLQARVKQESRPMLNCVGVFKHRAVCTDGHRLYMILHSGFAPGNYKVVSSDKSSIVLQIMSPEEGTFPEVVRVFPKKKVKSIKVNDSKVPGSQYTNIVRAMPEDQTLNYDYFSQTLTPEPWTVRITPDGGPVRFQNSGKSALIMPARI